MSKRVGSHLWPSLVDGCRSLVSSPSLPRQSPPPFAACESTACETTAWVMAGGGEPRSVAAPPSHETWCCEPHRSGLEACAPRLSGSPGQRAEGDTDGSLTRTPTATVALPDSAPVWPRPTPWVCSSQQRRKLAVRQAKGTGQAADRQRILGTAGREARVWSVPTAPSPRGTTGPVKRLLSRHSARGRRILCWRRMAPGCTQMHPAALGRCCSPTGLAREGQRSAQPARFDTAFLGPDARERQQPRTAA